MQGSLKKYKSKEEHDKDSDQHLASQEWGNYGFVLENPQRVDLIATKGKLGFWDFDFNFN